MEVIFERDNQGVKKPQHLQKNIFIIYSPRTVTVETANCVKIDTNITLNLPKKQKHFLHQNSEGTKFVKLITKKGVCG